MKKEYIKALTKMNIVATKKNLKKLSLKKRYKLNEIIQKKRGKECFDIHLPCHRFP